MLVALFTVEGPNIAKDFIDNAAEEAVNDWCHQDMAVYSRFCFDPGAGIHYGGYAGMWVREYPMARGWAP